MSSRRPRPLAVKKKAVGPLRLDQALVETLERARRIAIENGVRYVYTGNAHDKTGQSTYCYQCGQILIGRDGYLLSEWNLAPDGTCNKCGTACAGLFEATPGNWGNRRQPVRLMDFV